MMEMHTLNGQLFRFDPHTGKTWQLSHDNSAWVLIEEPDDADGDTGDDSDGDVDVPALAVQSSGGYARFHEVGARARVAVRTMAPDGVERELMIEEFAPLAVAFDAMWIGYLRDAGLMERNDAMGLWVKKPEAPVSYVVRDPAHLDNLPMPRMYYDRNGAAMHLLDQPDRVFTLEASDQEVAPIGRETPSEWPMGIWNRMPGRDGIRGPLKPDAEYEIVEGGPRYMRADSTVLLRAGAAPETTEGTIPTASPIPDTRGTVRFIGQRRAADGEGEGERPADEKPEPEPEQDYRSSAAWE